MGPHNGTDNFDIGRDNLLNSFDGRSICWSCGNGHDDQGFRRGTISASGGTESLTVTPTAVRDVPGGAEVPRDRFLDVWYSGPELDYEVSCGGVSSGWQTAGNDYLGNLNGYDVEVDRDEETSAGLRNIRFLFEDALSTDAFAVQMRDSAPSEDVAYQAWTGSQGWKASLNGATQVDLTLSDTTCAKSILSVGACAKRVPPSPAAGETITGYSGAGPTLDGRVKPEIVAVGGTDTNAVVSADSDQASGYVGMYGTSMAAPLTAGAVALLLEELGGLSTPLATNQDTIKALLTRHANRTGIFVDPAAPGYQPEHRNRYGHGRLRMTGPIDQLAPPLTVDVWIRTADDDWGHEPFLGDRYWRAPDIRVYQAGTMTEVEELTWGTTYDVRVRGRNLGDDDATNATVRLKYTQPFAAPSAWHAAENATDAALVSTVTVPALDEVEVLFHWRPEAGEIGAPAGTTHFCLLAEIDHPSNPLVYPAPTTAGGSAWETNIKGIPVSYQISVEVGLPTSGYG